jgi:hypothetical protein
MSAVRVYLHFGVAFHGIYYFIIDSLFCQFLKFQINFGRYLYQTIGGKHLRNLMAFF